MKLQTTKSNIIDGATFGICYCANLTIHFTNENVHYYNFTIKDILYVGHWTDSGKAYCTIDGEVYEHMPILLTKESFDKMINKTNMLRNFK